MGGPLVNSCLCFNLRTGTLVTLWLSLVVSIIGCIQLAVSITVVLHEFTNATMIKNTFFYEILPYLVFVSVPFALGLYGTFQRKPKFLMVAILDIFALTGFRLYELRVIIFTGDVKDRNIFNFVELFILWCFELVWYSYFSELTKSTRSRSEPLNPS